MSDTLYDRMLEAMLAVAATSTSGEEIYDATICATTSLLASSAGPGRETALIMQAVRQMAHFAGAMASIIPQEPAGPQPNAPNSRSTH